MTDRERLMATFTGEKVDRIVWQPRLEHWYNVNRKKGTLPPKYEEKGILNIYDEMRASPRYYYGTSADISKPRTFLKVKYTGGVRVEERRERNDIRVIYRTPRGQLQGKRSLGEWGCSWHYTEYPVKRISDLKILEYVLRNTLFEFDYDFYQEADRELGERGIVQFYFERSPLQNLFLFHMGLENTIYALYDYEKEMRDFLRSAEEAQDGLYEVLTECPVKVLNFGENIDAEIDPPGIFEKYLLPYYKRRVDQLHKAGKFCHIHMDGALKSLLPSIRKAGFDGIEAATPIPQGDVTLEELKEAMGDIILLDGIPAIMFLPKRSSRELEDFTRKILDLFSPNLILGISDELPPPGDINKVRAVSDMVEKYKLN